MAGGGTELGNAAEDMFKGDSKLSTEEKLEKMLPLFLDSAKKTPGYMERMITLIKNAKDEGII